MKNYKKGSITNNHLYLGYNLHTVKLTNSLKIHRFLSIQPNEF